MDTVLVMLVTIVFIGITMITSVLSTRISKNTFEETFKNNPDNKDENNSSTSLLFGYAYSVDTSNSAIIIVVLDKRRSYVNSHNIQPLTIKVRDLDNTK
jgi:hypothetical protein